MEEADLPYASPLDYSASDERIDPSSANFQLAIRQSVNNLVQDLGLNPTHEAAMYITDGLLHEEHVPVRQGDRARKLYYLHLQMRPYTRSVQMALVLFCFFEMPSWCASNPDCASTLEHGRLTGNFSSGYPFLGSAFISKSTNRTAGLAYQARRAGGEPVLYPLFGLPIMHSIVAQLVELPLLLFLVFEVVCQMSYMGHAAFFKPCARCLRPRWYVKGSVPPPRGNGVVARLKRHAIALASPFALLGDNLSRRPTRAGYAVVVAVALLDALLRFPLPKVTGKLSPYLRMLLMVTPSTPILQELRLVFNTLKPLSGIAMVLVAFLIFSSWVGILLFADDRPGSQGELYFTSLTETAWQLFICLTTANYPDVMMPAFSADRASFIFFFVFLTLGTFFLLNVVIAVVCNEYNAQRAQETATLDAMRSRALTCAFELLDTDRSGFISRGMMDQVFIELRHYRGRSDKLDEDKARVLFGAMDGTGRGRVDREEFMRICQLLAVKLRSVRGNGLFSRTFPAFYASACFRRLEAIVRSRRFDIGIDLLLGCNAVILLVDEVHILDGSQINLGEYRNSLARDTFFTVAEITFASLFAVETVLKLLSMGWDEYTSRLRNCFDGTVSVISVGGALYEYGIQVGLEANVSADARPGSIARIVLALRLGRLARVLGEIPQVAIVVATFARMLPAAGKLLKVLFVIMFFFSTLGVQIFGGLINFGPQYETLRNDAYGAADYYANNFNDLASGMVVCFELLVVNNWFIIASGFSAVVGEHWVPAARDPTGPGTWRPKPPARLFFVAVYIFGVLVCLNIVVAFALDSFNQVLAETKAEKGEAERRLLEDCDGSGGAAEGQGEEGEGGPRVGPRSRFSVHSASISAAQRQFRVSIPAALHVSGLRADTKKALLEIGPADRSDRAPKRPQGDLGQGKRSPPLPPPDDGVELSGPRSEDPAHVDADAAWAGNNGSGSSSDGEGARAHTPDE